MANVQKAKTKKLTGPYLDLAVICEGLVQEKDFTLTPVRLVNRITIHEEAPKHGDLLTLPLFLLIGFKAGDIVGERKFTLNLVTPSGEQKEFLKDGTLPPFQGDDSGAHVMVALHVPYAGEGTYWLELFLEGKQYSRVPLTILFKPKSE